MSPFQEGKMSSIEEEHKEPTEAIEKIVENLEVEISLKDPKEKQWLKSHIDKSERILLRLLWISTFSLASLAGRMSSGEIFPPQAQTAVERINDLSKELSREDSETLRSLEHDLGRNFVLALLSSPHLKESEPRLKPVEIRVDQTNNPDSVLTSSEILEVVSALPIALRINTHTIVIDPEDRIPLTQYGHTEADSSAGYYSNGVATISGGDTYVFYHELAHGADPLNNPSLTLHEKITFYRRLTDRVKEGQFALEYPNSINVADEQQELYLKTSEYFAEIFAHTLNNYGPNDRSMPKEDRQIIQDLVSLFEADYDYLGSLKKREEILGLSTPNIDAINEHTRAVNAESLWRGSGTSQDFDSWYSANWRIITYPER